MPIRNEQSTTSEGLTDNGRKHELLNNLANYSDFTDKDFAEKMTRFAAALTKFVLVDDRNMGGNVRWLSDTEYQRSKGLYIKFAVAEVAIIPPQDTNNQVIKVLSYAKYDERKSDIPKYLVGKELGLVTHKFHGSRIWAKPHDQVDFE